MNTNLQISEHDATILGHRLRIRQLNLKARPQSARSLLVFLHEGLGCIETWRDFPQSIALACGCDALIYDRLGHGKSDRLSSPAPDGQYLHTEALDFLPVILAECGIKRCVLIGHSDGGSIALLFAAQYPHLLAGVVTEAAHVYVDEVTMRGVRQTVQAFQTTGLRAKLARYHGQKVDNLFWRWANTWLSAEFAAWNIKGCLPAIQCPLLTIQGQADEYGAPAQARAIAGQVSGHSQTLLIPDCGHSPHRQATRVVGRHIAEFIAKL